MESEKVIFNVIGDEKKAALIRDMHNKGTIEITNSTGVEPGVGEYLGVKRISLEIDEVMATLAGQLGPLNHVASAMNGWKSEKISIPRAKEYGIILSAILDKVRAANIELMQVASYLGNDLGNVFEALCPAKLGDCPECGDQENTPMTRAECAAVSVPRGVSGDQGKNV